VKVLHLDSNHPLLIEQLAALGCDNHEDYQSPKSKVLREIHLYDGIIIRSRFSIDRKFIDTASQLKFIGRVGAGLENIDTAYATSKGIELISAPEGNRNAVGEHCLGMLLSLFNNLNKANAEVKSGHWLREANRGHELDGKTIGLIGYGNMGKAFAKKLKGFEVKVLCYDIKDGVGDDNAQQVPLEELQKRTEVLSLHTPQTPLTIAMVNESFINAFRNPFWLINTARGSGVVTKDLVTALKRGRILGAGLDVLEYEKASFEHLFPNTEGATERAMPDAFKYLLESDRVLLTPHVAGWTVESHRKLAQTIVDKIRAKFF